MGGEMPASNKSGVANTERRDLPIRALRLDTENPRLPLSMRGGTQEDLAVGLVLGFEAFAVAQSIADHGFFKSEPLLVIAAPNEAGAWTVVEGNRRLTALLGLAFPEYRAQFPDAGKWDQLAAKCGVSPDDLIPAVAHANRSSTHVEVGRAHVLGKLQWRPYAQATYVASRIQENFSYAEVADMIGIPKSKVADLYRDHAIVVQAQELGLKTGEIEKAFSLLTVAMSSTKLRDHIGAPLGSRLNPREKPVPESKSHELSEVITWIFGTDEEEPKIHDSRQISQLGNVVAHPIGLKALRDGDGLDQAKQKIAAAGLDPKERLIARLRTALNTLLAASDDISDFATDPQVTRLVDDVEAAVASLRSVIDEAEQGHAD
jgi:hypothetical protein